MAKIDARAIFQQKLLVHAVETFDDGGSRFIAAAVFICVGGEIGEDCLGHRG